MTAPLMFGSSRGGTNSLRPGFTGDGHIVYSGHGEGEAAVANTLKVPSHGASWSGGSSDTFVNGGASVRRLTPTECERRQALRVGWTQLAGRPTLGASRAR